MRAKPLCTALLFTMIAVLVQPIVVLGIEIVWVDPSWEVTVNETAQGNASVRHRYEDRGDTLVLGAEAIVPPGDPGSSTGGLVQIFFSRIFAADGQVFRPDGSRAGRTFFATSFNGQLISSFAGLAQGNLSVFIPIHLGPPVFLASWGFQAENEQTINVSEAKLTEVLLPAGQYLVGVSLIVGADTFALAASAAALFLDAVRMDVIRVDPTIAPVANAGPDQTVRPGSSVTLDGSGSFDPQGQTPLGFAWTITAKPAGSAATLTGADTSLPSFTADVPGEYRIQLVVTNSLGTRSDPDVVVVSTVNSAPIAAAGPDQVVTRRGTTIQLDGSQSFDPDGDIPLTFAWALLQKPATSAATLSNAASPTPTFIADVQGDYLLRLVVTDLFGAASEPDTVLVSFNNMPPVANAGLTQTVLVGATVVLDGS
jgi:hypothetical protein